LTPMTREELRSASKPPASTASRTQGGTRYCLDRGALCARGAAQGRLAAVHSQGAVKSNLRVLTTQHVAGGPSSHNLKARLARRCSLARSPTHRLPVHCSALRPCRWGPNHYSTLVLTRQIPKAKNSDASEDGQRDFEFLCVPDGCGGWGLPQGVVPPSERHTATAARVFRHEVRCWRDPVRHVDMLHSLYLPQHYTHSILFI
jgi:hypothetical protein